MDVLVDTSVWSLVLRRRPALSGQQLDLANELRRLFKEKRACIIGAIRQELLSGARTIDQLARLREALREFADVPVPSTYYERAAELNFQLRSKGIKGKSTDLLICATALERDMAVFTTDKDFEHFKRGVPLRLHTIGS